jgi:hypothetical protein
MQRTSQAIEQEIEQQRELLGIHRANLHQLRLREAKHGLEPPLAVINQIADTEQQIRVVEAAIGRLEQEAVELARTEALSADERRLVEAFMDQRKRSEGITTARPLALAICLIPSLRSIKADVEGYLASKGWAMPVEELVMPGLNDINDIALLIVGLRRKKQAIQDAGYSEVHLFIAGPIVAGVAVGGIFDNWKPIKLYHKANNTPAQSYEYWMPLIGT